MNVESEKSELINWINSLKDSQILQQIILLKKKTELPSKSTRNFGDGKYLISYIADDFADPIDHFDEDIRP